MSVGERLLRIFMAAAAGARIAAVRRRQLDAARASGGLYTSGTGTYSSGTYIQQSFEQDLQRMRANHRQNHRQASLSFGDPSTEVPPRTLRLRPGMEIRATELVNCSSSTPVIPGDECDICLVAFAEGDPLRVPSCGHAFHSKCLRQWFEQGGPRCPTCRHVVKLPPEAETPPDACGGTLAMRMLGLEETAEPQPTRRGSLAALVRKFQRSFQRPRRVPPDPDVFLDEYYW